MALQTSSQPYVLGLDLGTNSVGWALIGGTLHNTEASASPQDTRFYPQTLLAAGSRVFEAAVEGGEANIAAGKEESLAKGRRDARGARRVTERRAMRTHHLFLLLVQQGLLPKDASALSAPKGMGKTHWQQLQAKLQQGIERALKEYEQHPPTKRLIYQPGRVTRYLLSEARDLLLSALDRHLLPNCAQKWGTDKNLTPHLLPYLLRQQALTTKLDPWELGRALFQLGQRRGFLSNRKSPEKEGDDLGVVKQGISELEAKIEECDTKTLGGYLASQVNPVDYSLKSLERIRQRWTARGMFQKEFKAIWRAQQEHHPSLQNSQLRQKIDDAMFYQRPLKSAKHLIGLCELEPTSPETVWRKSRRGRYVERVVLKGEPRLAKAHPLAQRFRYVQVVNDLKCILPNQPQRPLTAKERQLALGMLARAEKVSFAALKKALGLPAKTAFTHEGDEQTGKKKEVIGDRSAAKIRAVIGDAWEALGSDQQECLLEALMTIESETSLERHLGKHYGFSTDHAEKLALVSLEDGYSNLSRKALQKVLPLMEAGVNYASARKCRYPDADKQERQEDLLPPAQEVLANLRNPAVLRTLTELRRVVNTIIRQRGGQKPEMIRIELARDLKKSKKAREEISKKNNVRRKEREAAKKQLQEETDIKNPSRNDIDKCLLFKECAGVSPYTGDQYGLSQVMGGAMEIEHIFPQSASLDNSFANKTLCEPRYNRHTKKNNPPWHGISAEERSQMIARVKRFTGGYAKEKRRRFSMSQAEYAEEMQGFSNRQLNDTAYASRLAAKYLAVLYGRDALGNQETGAPKRIRTSTGGVTALFRGQMGLNKIFGKTRADKEQSYVAKSREDHRHHALDAFVVAITDDALIKKMNTHLAELDEKRRNDPRERISFSAPWEGMGREIEEVIGRAITSHRSSHRARGALHKDTNYRYKHQPQLGDTKKVMRKRQPVAALTSKEKIKDIPDPLVRQVLRERIEEYHRNYARIKEENKRLDAEISALKRKISAAEKGTTEDNVGELKRKIQPLEAKKDPTSLKDYLVAYPPRMPNGQPVYKVRVKVVGKAPQAVGEPWRQRHVKTGSNHHVAIFETTDKKGNLIWEGDMVTQLEAQGRKQRGEPLIQSQCPNGRKFMMHLCGGDIIQLHEAGKEPSVYRLRKISQDVAQEKAKNVSLTYIEVNCAQPLISTKDKEGHNYGKVWWSKGVKTLREAKMQKMVITPLGELRRAGD